MRLLWLPEVLRRAGLTVREVPGWQTRSGPEDEDASTFVPRGVVIHETRSPRIASDADEIRVLVEGRVGLSGPIAQLYLGRGGVWHVVAAGLCHHVRTGWGGPFTGLGNSRLLGVEPAHTVSVDGSGRRLETWAQKRTQYVSYVKGVAAILRYTGWPAPVGHKEHQPGDKPDPEFDMGQFRRDVAHVLAGGSLDMEQTEPLIMNKGKTVGNFMYDVHQLRAWLVNPPDTAVPGAPPPGSVGALLVAAAQRPAPEPPPLATVDVEALALALRPHIEAAAEAAVRKVLGSVDE